MSAALPATPAWAASPWPFFLVTFLFSWGCFGAVLALGQRVSFTPPSAGLLLSVLGDFGPVLAAVLLTSLAAGRVGLRRLVERVTRVPQVRVLLVALLAVPLLVQVGNILGLLGGAGAPAVWLKLDAGTLLLLPAFVVFALAEQTGWRGYAQPRLRDRYGLVGASLVLGLLWAVWHLPLFWVPGSGQFGQAFAPYLLEVTGWSFLMTWVWHHGRQSVLPCLVLHFSINASAVMLGTVPGSGEWRLVLWALVIVSAGLSFRRSARRDRGAAVAPGGV